MRIFDRHPWDLDLAAATELQKRLAPEIDTETPVTDWQIVAGTDVSYNRLSPIHHAAVVVLDAASGQVIERRSATARVRFPYVPGFLSFREIPALLEALAQVESRPDVVLCDGQGIAHPRRMGIASHLGLWLEVPTIGCAKSRLFGRYEEPGPRRGDQTDLLDPAGRVIGAVLRTKDRVKPVFVSPGHRCDVASTVAIVLALSGRYRLPTPTRLAHDHVNAIRRSHAES